MRSAGEPIDVGNYSFQPIAMYMTNRIHRLYGDSLLPPVTLRHIKTLTDCTGILQHAKYGIPNRFEGYCTDDNVRALLVTAKHYNVFKDESIFNLLRTYMAFTFYAQKEDGLVHNFMSYQRDFLDSVGSDDMLGRTLWACGYVCSSTTLPKSVREVARIIFEQASKHATSDFSLRGIAYSLLGFCHSRASIPKTRGKIRVLAAEMLHSYEDTRAPDWEWFEDIMSYSNARLPQAMLVSLRCHWRAATSCVRRKNPWFSMGCGDHP